MAKELKHIGTPRHSGRYPWGSGEKPQQRNTSLLGRIQELEKQGLSEVDVAKGMGMKTTQLRLKKSLAKTDERKENAEKALKLKAKGHSNVAIGQMMGVNESTVRSWLNPAIKERSELTGNIANMLKDQVEKKEYIDVGIGVERHLGISRVKLKTAITALQEEGYKLHFLKIKQVGTGKYTTTTVLSKPDVPYTEVFNNKDKIHMITDYSEDGGRSFLGLEPIRSVSSKRIKIRYEEDGGKNKDGVIELRRGVDELSLGGKNYAQVRIGVDGTHYLKGMAIYSDDMPDGIDIVYNTNKSKTTPKEKVFKEMKDDPDNPFGATVRQKHYVDSKGKQQLSALNVVGSPNKEGSGEEGAWESWSRTLSSQILSKQAPSLAKKQLDLAYDEKKKEYDEILELTNPVVKQKLLKSFGDNVDSAAVHLKGAAMPRQMSHILLPLPKMKETEVYAPNYDNGEKVVLIRHPHGGIFEIPELTVNNNNPSGRRIFGGIRDAVGVNPKVAEQLSGADFDGDTVLVIPNPARGGIRTASPLKALKDFDAKAMYKLSDEEVASGKFKVMGTKGGGTTGQRMGDISNLITDMTIKGANTDEIAKAVKHSMVVIDAEKHKLDYTRSYIDNGIAALKQKYQGGANRGASTLISRASSDERVFKRKPRSMKKGGPIDLDTGRKMWEYTDETYVSRKTGKVIKATDVSTKMAEVDDAHTLSSGTPMETVYANHANKLKALANEARKSYLKVEKFKYSPSAKEAYATEVASLKSKLNIALKNAPLERHAQLLANNIIKAKKDANPDITPEDLKKLSNQALAEARTRLGAKKEPIDISDREWEAIQARAISANTLSSILDNAKPERIKQLATPRQSTALSASKIQRAKQMLSSNNTRADVARALGISVSTLSKYVD